jgi:hypothetical protein
LAKPNSEKVIQKVPNVVPPFLTDGVDLDLVPRVLFQVPHGVLDEDPGIPVLVGGEGLDVAHLQGNISWGFGGVQYHTLPLYTMWTVNPQPAYPLGAGCPQGEFSILVFVPSLDSP